MVHNIRALAMAKIYCTCSWSHMPEKVNRVPENILAEQIESAFLEHQREMVKIEKNK